MSQSQPRASLPPQASSAFSASEAALSFFRPVYKDTTLSFSSPSPSTPMPPRMPSILPWHDDSSAFVCADIRCAFPAMPAPCLSPAIFLSFFLQAIYSEKRRVHRHVIEVNRGYFAFYKGFSIYIVDMLSFCRKLPPRYRERETVLFTPSHAEPCYRFPLFRAYYAIDIYFYIDIERSYTRDRGALHCLRPSSEQVIYIVYFLKRCRHLEGLTDVFQDAICLLSSQPSSLFFCFAAAQAASAFLLFPLTCC